MTVKQAARLSLRSAATLFPAMISSDTLPEEAELPSTPATAKPPSTAIICPVINDAFSTPVRCIISEENILFSCTSAVGRATENFPITLEGEEFEIGLNSRYLLEALKASEVDNVKIEFNGATSGVLIKPTENEEFLYMIMPMRLR